MGLTPVNQFVLAVSGMYKHKIECIGVAIYSWSGGVLKVFSRDGELILERTMSEGAEFVRDAVEKLFRNAGWDLEDVERTDIGDEEDIPVVARCKTTRFLKRSTSEAR